MNENQATPLRVSVRSVYDGAQFRMRAGRKWTSAATVVEIVDAPTDANQISPAQYQALVEDRYIAVSAVGGTDPAIPSLKAEMIKAEQTVKQLREELANAQDATRAEREQSAQQVAELGARIVALESDLAAARSSLAEKARKRA